MFLINKFKNIKDVYNIIDICDNHILVNYCGKSRKIYIYELSPIVILNVSNDLKSNIVSNFTEFLRLVNFNFQILCRNTKFNINDYITNLYNKIEVLNIDKKGIYENYIKSLKSELGKENIFDTKYYIIVSIENDEDNIEKTIQKLEKIGCMIKRINNKKELCDLLNYCINKEEEEIEL